MVKFHCSNLTAIFSGVRNNEVCPKSSWTTSKTVKGGPVDLKSNHISKG